MLKKMIVVASLSVSPAYSLTQVGFSCPEKIIANVLSVSDVSSSAFPKVEVEFQVIEVIKGEEVAIKKIQVAKDGPVEFKVGVVYSVEFNHQWLCSANIYSIK